jgi:hypothetical protein
MLNLLRFELKIKFFLWEAYSLDLAQLLIEGLLTWWASSSSKSSRSSILSGLTY